MKIVSPLKKPEKKKEYDFCDEIGDRDERELCEEGRSEGNDIALTHLQMEEYDIEQIFDGWVDGFNQSASYANHFLPRVRAMAGCEDVGGVGSYQGCNEEQMDKVSELIDAYNNAVSEGIEETFNEDVDYLIHKAKNERLSLGQFETLIREAKDPRILRALAERDDLREFPDRVTAKVKLYSTKFKREE